MRAVVEIFKNKNGDEIGAAVHFVCNECNYISKAVSIHSDDARMVANSLRDRRCPICSGKIKSNVDNTDAKSLFDGKVREADELY